MWVSARRRNVEEQLGALSEEDTAGGGSRGKYHRRPGPWNGTRHHAAGFLERDIAWLRGTVAQLSIAGAGPRRNRGNRFRRRLDRLRWRRGLRELERQHRCRARGWPSDSRWHI